MCTYVRVAWCVPMCVLHDVHTYMCTHLPQNETAFVIQLRPD